MAMSAFGDPLDDDVPAQPAPKAPAVSAFGDPIEDDEPAAVPHGGINAWAPEGLRRFLDAADDYGTSLSKGMVGLGEAGVGIANILSGGAAGNALEEHAGWNPEQRRRELEAEATPGYRQAQEAVRNVTGFGSTFAEILNNPGVIPHAIAESAPSMMLGGVVGRGVGALGQLAGRAAPILAPAIGEGVVAAGQAAEQTRQATGDLSASGAGLALLSGAATGALGALGAKLGRSLGVADVDAQLAGQRGAEVARGLVARVIGGGALEGSEETLQSASEQMLQNLAAGRPMTEGVGQAGAMGLATGGVMGGAAGVRRPNVVGQPVQQQPVDQMAQQGAQLPAQAVQDQAATIGQPTQAPQPTPFAGSADIAPLLDRLGVQGDQRAQTIDLMTPAEPGMESRRRGTVSLDEQHRLAGMIGLEGAKKLEFERKIGQAWNAEETLAVTNHVHERLEAVMKLQSSITDGTATDIQKAQFVSNVMTLRQSFGELLGARAEAGRALAAYRNITDMQGAADMLERVGGAAGADAMAKAMGQALKSGGLPTLSKVIGHETLSQKLLGRYWRAALLTSPSTHVTNTVGNLGMLATEVIERSVAAGIGAAKRAVTGGKSGQTVFNEPLQLVLGAAKGQLKAWQAGNTAWETGESNILGSGIKEPGQSLSLKPETMGGKVDYALTLPYRMLAVQDAYLAQINFEGELRALAYQQAQTEKRSGQLQGKVAERVEQLLANPTPAMIESSTAHARRMTFNDPGGPLVNAITGAKRKFPVLELVAPFVRTPTNLAKAAIKRSPLAIFAPTVIEDIKAGGAAQERALARIGVGTSFMILAGALAQAGRITGAGPDDPEEKRALLASGWQPYSFRTKDGTYVQYNRADPFAALLGLASDLATSKWKDADASELTARVIGSFAENLLNKTYMSGVSDLLGMLDEPKRRSENWFNRLGAGLLQPFGIVNRAASADDPFARETDSFTDALRYRVPGLRRELPQKLDAFGFPVPNAGYVGEGWPNWAAGVSSPTRTSEDSADPVRMEARRLAWNPSEPQKYMTIKGERHELTAEQHHELRALAGHLTYLEAAKLVADPRWSRLSDTQKTEVLEKQATKARANARLAMLPLLAMGDRRSFDALRARTDAALQQLKTPRN